MSNNAATSSSPAIFKISEIIPAAITTWNSHVAESRRYAEAHQSKFNNLKSAASEFETYAYILTQIAKPYSFAKKRSALFVDEGWGTAHEGRSSDFRGGFTETEIGMVDFWAAAQVDSRFKALCQQRTEVYNRGYQIKNSEQAPYHDVFETGTSAPLTYRWDDPLRGRLDSFFSLGVNYENMKSRDIGATYRLNGALKRRFKSLIKNGETRAAIERVRTGFFDEFKNAEKAQRNALIEASRIRSQDPARDTLKLTSVRQMAYLNMLGQDEIPAVRNDLQESLNEAVRRERAYVAGKLPAPPFSEDAKGDSLTKTLDAIVYDRLGAARPLEPLVNEEPVYKPETDPFYRDQDSYYYNNDTYYKKPVQTMRNVPEKSKAMAAAFLATTKTRAELRPA